jgi:DNA-directed RNA polymerase subunit RPC12/RpoP
MIAHCPHCGYRGIRASRPRGWEERLASFVGLCHFRCRRCRRRFPRQVVLLANGRWARCPTCLGQDLTDWSEKYSYPGGLSRLWSRLGGRGHRCEACRLNFVSFYARRAIQAPATTRSTSAVETGPEQARMPAAPEVSPEGGEWVRARPKFPAGVRLQVRWRALTLIRRVANLPKWRVRVVWKRPPKEANAGWAETATPSQVTADS